MWFRIKILFISWLCFGAIKAAEVGCEIEVSNNTQCNGEVSGVSIFEMKYPLGNVYDVFRSPAYPTQGEEIIITAHTMPYRSSTGISMSELELANGNYMGLVDRGSVEELDLTDPLQAEVYRRLTTYSVILGTGVDVNKIKLVATALFNANGDLIEYIGRYGVIWGLAQEGFLFVDYSAAIDYGTFYFTEPIELGSYIKYTPEYTIVGSLDVISSYFTAINDEDVTTTCTGTAEVIGLSNPENYEFLWNDPRKQKTAKAEGLCAGDYTVKVKKQNYSRGVLFNSHCAAK